MRASADRIARLGDARRRWQDALGRIVSKDAAAKLHAFSRHERDALRAYLRQGEATKPRPSTREAYERSLRVMKDAGVDRAKLHAAYGEYKSDVASLARPSRTARDALRRVSIQDVPQPVRDGVVSGDFRNITTTSDGLTIFTPPYDGWWWKGSWWRSGGDDPEIDIYPDPATGSIGHRSHWYNGDASDADAFTLDYDTSVSVWYKPPKNGLLDVFIMATCSSAHYEVYLDDEWGFSDSGTWMQSHITANVSPVIDDEDRTQIWSADVSGSPDDSTTADDPFPPSNVQMFHLTTSQALAGGVWSMLRVGTYEHRFTLLNDVSTSQLMRNRWFVNAIFVRTQ